MTLSFMTLIYDLSFMTKQEVPKWIRVNLDSDKKHSKALVCAFYLIRFIRMIE